MVLKSLGFEPYIPDDVFKRDGYLAGSEQCRADVLNRLLADANIKGVLCARGGFGSMKLLPLLNFDKLGALSKVFIGFSDITALLVNFYQRCNWVVFHGPTVNALANADSKSLEGFKLAVSGRSPITLFSNGRAIVPGSASGPLIAGNLTTLCHLVGTPYMPDLSGCILLVEDQGEAPYRIDRMLTHMKMAGCFQQLAGLALGDFLNCGSLEHIEGIAAKLLGDYRIPILSGFDVGHDRRNMTVPLGLDATLDTGNKTLTLDSSATIA